MLVDVSLIVVMARNEAAWGRVKVWERPGCRICLDAFAQSRQSHAGIRAMAHR